MKIILASNSPRRKELLEKSGLTFSVIPSSVEENISKSVYTFYTITVLRTYSDFRGSVKGDTVLDYYHGYGTQKILNGDYIHHTDYYTIEI